ncbi:uncharacterized protein SAPINGB_P002558 [Magnusiomyces paraingens]|uniref:Uncharacterized protein n=1 Tax=Magnusiomyces paraingens TaxID=2606893 RepID=A0A5E8BEJ1_9ASCO|nr:uncharacterized protein SAPINGB_P002558 [Saprochaete ingens]VVT50015.1 unnamed protein product [Saprochaete ingens]
MPLLPYDNNMENWLNSFKEYLDSRMPGLKSFVFDDFVDPRVPDLRVKLQAEYAKILNEMEQAPTINKTVAPVLRRFENYPSVGIEALCQNYSGGTLGSYISLIRALVIPREPDQTVEEYLNSFLTCIKNFGSVPPTREILIAIMAAGARSNAVFEKAQNVINTPLSVLSQEQIINDLTSIATGSDKIASKISNKHTLEIEPILWRSHAHRRSYHNDIIYDPPLGYSDIQKLKHPSQAAPWRKAMTRTLTKLHSAKAIETLSQPPLDRPNTGVVRWIYGKSRSTNSRKLIPSAKLIVDSDPRAIQVFHEPPPSSAVAKKSSVRLALRLFPSKSSYRYFDLSQEFHSTRLETPLIVRLPAVDPLPSHRRPYARIVNCIRGADLTPWTSKVKAILAKRGYIQTDWDPAVYELDRDAHPKRAMALLLEDHLLLLDDNSVPHWKTDSVYGFFKHAELIGAPNTIFGAKLVFNKENILIALCGSDLITGLLHQFDLYNLLRTAQEPRVMDWRDYAIIIRNLQFIASWIRPDISAKVLHLNIIQCKNTEPKHLPICTLLHTLQRSQNYSLNFPVYTTLRELNASVYVDYNEVSGTSGWVVSLFGTPIHWETYRPHRSLRTHPGLPYCEMLRRANAATNTIHAITRALTSSKTLNIENFNFPETVPATTSLVWAPRGEIQFITDELRKLPVARAIVLMRFWQNFTADNVSFSLKSESRLSYMVTHPGHILSGSHTGAPANIMGTFMTNVN